MAKHASEYRGARRNAARGQRWRGLRQARKALGWTRSKFDKARHVALLHMARQREQAQGEAGA